MQKCHRGWKIRILFADGFRSSFLSGQFFHLEMVFSVEKGLSRIQVSEALDLPSSSIEQLWYSIAQYQSVSSSVWVEFPPNHKLLRWGKVFRELWWNLSLDISRFWAGKPFSQCLWYFILPRAVSGTLENGNMHRWWAVAVDEIPIKLGSNFLPYLCFSSPALEVQTQRLGWYPRRYKFSQASSSWSKDSNNGFVFH